MEISPIAPRRQFSYGPDRSVYVGIGLRGQSCSIDSVLSLFLAQSITRAMNTSFTRYIAVAGGVDSDAAAMKLLQMRIPVAACCTQVRRQLTVRFGCKLNQFLLRPSQTLAGNAFRINAGPVARLIRRVWANRCPLGMAGYGRS